MGFAKLGAIFGVFLGAVLMHAFGRKLTIEWTGLFFIMGPLIMSVARAWPALVPPPAPALAQSAVEPQPCDQGASSA